MKFCSNCAGPLDLKIPVGDNLPRHVCIQCGMIHYQNPKIVTGCLPFFEDKVLLCKRAIEPRKGYWTLPAGFMENGESTEEGALRETLEEANAFVNITQLYSITSIINVISQVQFIYLAELEKPEFSESSESSEVRLFCEKEIPWEEIAFNSIENVLRNYFQDRKRGSFSTREFLVKRK